MALIRAPSPARLSIFAVVIISCASFFCSRTDFEVRAADPQQQEPSEDFQDLVFLGDHGPVILRLHILIDGKPFPTVWDDAIRSLFNYLDRNGDGVLSKQEAERAPKVQRLLQQVRVGNFFVASGGTA